MDSAKPKPPYLIISKTLWSDTPRIRHQLARLLASNGHSVFFVQKNTPLGPLKHSIAEPKITLLQHGEVLHHQLRFQLLLSMLNARYENSQMERLRNEFKLHDSVILNCNYDSGYLRRVFPKNQIVTLLHDDYIAGARKWMKKRTEIELKKTLSRSDRVLAVSYSLVRQSKHLGKDCELFLPWTRTKYKQPQIQPNRDDILFWGYFYDNLDFNVFTYIANKGIIIHIVGPVLTPHILKKLNNHPNIKYHGICDLADISHIVDRCCCSLLPYNPNAGDGTVQAVTISNRAFELLAHGMPLLYANLPELLEAPREIICKCTTPEDYLSAYENAQKNFNTIQPIIQKFLEPHNPESRYRQLTSSPYSGPNT